MAVTHAQARLERLLLGGGGRFRPRLVRPEVFLGKRRIVHVHQRMHPRLGADDQFGVRQQQAGRSFVGRVERREILDARFLNHAKRLLNSVGVGFELAGPCGVGRG